MLTTNGDLIVISAGKTSADYAVTAKYRVFLKKDNYQGNPVFRNTGAFGYGIAPKYSAEPTFSPVTMSPSSFSPMLSSNHDDSPTSTGTSPNVYQVNLSLTISSTHLEILMISTAILFMTLLVCACYKYFVRAKTGTRKVPNSVIRYVRPNTIV